MKEEETADLVDSSLESRRRGRVIPIDLLVSEPRPTIHTHIVRREKEVKNGRVGEDRNVRGTRTT
jgi:hypothetical protein